MNERIRELLNEATSGLEPDLSPQRTVTLNELEKFAELIVRECAEWLKQPVNQIPSSKEAMNIAADRLKEHFGVEL